MTRKGQISIIPAVFWGVFVLIGATAFIPSVKTDFRARKAVEKCMITEKVSENTCKNIISGMPEDQILSYIKDDDIPDKPLNFGNVN